MNPTIELIKRHRSIRKYKPDPLTAEQIAAIISAAQMASTSSNVQAYSVIGVTDPAKRKRLAELSGNQAYVEQCPLFLVWCADLYRLKLACEKQHTEMVHGTMENFIVATVDTALAAQNAALAAESMGLGIVYIGGIRNDPQGVVEVLSLPELVYPVFGMCVGYPDQDPEIRPRPRMDLIYHENEYNSDQYDRGFAEYDQVMREYYHRRTKGGKDTTWTEQMAEKFARASRPHLRGFLEKQGFRFQ